MGPPRHRWSHSGGVRGEVSLVSDAEVEAAAKAMYEFNLKAACDAIDRLSFDPMEVPTFVNNLKDESETAQVLIFYSYLDDRVKSIIALHMHDLTSQTAQDKLFGTNGPLNTFSSRILLSYHLGWLTVDQKERLEAFRKVRNEFAHRAFQVDFKTPTIASHVARLDYTSTGLFERLSKSVPRIAVHPTVLANLVLLALKTFEQLLVFPIAKTFHVDPYSIINKRPALLRTVQHSLTECLLLTGTEQWPAPIDGL